MRSYSTRIEKKHFYWLAGKMGYPTGIFNKVKWNEYNIAMIMREWAERFEVLEYFYEIGFCNNCATLSGYEMILLDVYHRTVRRPAEGLPPRIAGSPLPPEYERLLDLNW